MTSLPKAIEDWESEFDRRYNNMTWVAELAAEYHQGDPDLSGLKAFIRKTRAEALSQGKKDGIESAVKCVPGEDGYSCHECGGDGWNACRERTLEALSQGKKDGIESAVNYIEEHCPQIAHLDTNNGRLRIEIETMPEGTQFLLLTNKTIEEASALSQSDVPGEVNSSGV